MRILAVYPTEPELAVFDTMPPLGLLWVAGALRCGGHEVAFLDTQVDHRDAGELAAEFRPGLTLIGGTTHSRFASFETARKVKEGWPETLVAYGGPHASFTAEDTLLHVPEIDFIARGEGEATAGELAAWASNGGRAEDLGRIDGLVWRDDGRIRQNRARSPIRNLDLLGPPARDLVPMARYSMRMDYLDLPGAAIMTARGCPIGCTFCSASAMFGTAYRRRSPAAVIDEVETLLGQEGTRGIKIFDSTFSFNRRHVEGFCAEVERRGLRFPWECEIRVGSVDRRLLERMQRCGCYYVDVGIESGSQRVLDECVAKRIRLSAAEDLLSWTRELGLLTKVFFTIGHPGETYAEACETNRYYWKHRRRIRLAAFQAGIKIYPGTPVESYAWEHDLMPAGFRWSAPFQNLVNRKLLRDVDNVPLLIQPELGVRELRRLRLRFVAMRLSSPRFLVEKTRAILRQRSFGEYVKIIGRGTWTRRPPRPSCN